MAEKQFKVKDMIIAVICTLLVILAVIFYFLPAFSVQHSASLSIDDGTINSYSAWQITQALFTRGQIVDLPTSEVNFGGLLAIKKQFGMAIALSGILMPLSIICMLVTAVFAYISWFKGEQFKKYCFLFSLCGMVFATITLISTWYVAIQLRSGEVYIESFNVNMKGTIAYASFVSLILAFVVAIVACAYNYFLDNFDDEDEEDDEDDDEDEEEEEEEVVKPKKVKAAVVQDAKKEEKAVVAKVDATKKTTTKSTTTKTTTEPKKTTTTKSTATKSTIAKKTTAK